jgi:branched-chain amino acid transport system ATP-binding protein
VDHRDTPGEDEEKKRGRDEPATAEACAMMLEVRGLCAFYGQSQALHDIGFAIEEGGIVTLLGANGAGKTTTLRALCGMVRTSGEIAFDGKPIAGRATETITRLGIAHVPEGRGTFTRMTVEENLQLGAMARRDRGGIAADIEEVYGEFPRLKERRRQQAGTLSGGEQQMLAVGRALMLRPRLLLLDEPSFGLAPLIVAELFGILRRLNQRRRVAMLIVEQNAALALDLAEEAYLLETGRIVMAGAAREIAKDEAVRRSYLGY